MQVAEIWLFLLIVYLVHPFQFLHSLLQKQMFYFNWCGAFYSRKANNKVAFVNVFLENFFRMMECIKEELNLPFCLLS